MRRRQLLANLIVTAAATAGASLPGREPESAGETSQGGKFVERVRDAMLGLTPAPALISPATGSLTGRASPAA